MSNAASLLGLARFQALANSIEVKKSPAFDEDSIIYIDGEMVTIGDLVKLWQEVRKQTKKIDEALKKTDELIKSNVESSPKKKRQSSEQPKNGKTSESSSKKSKKSTRSPSNH